MSPSETAAARLITAYKVGHSTSGVITANVRFSAYAGRWKVTSKVTAGRKYSDTEANLHWSVADIHIDAVLPPVWHTGKWPADPAFYLTTPPGFSGSPATEIIIGSKELEPPAGVDRLELLCISFTPHPNSPTLASHWYYRFTKDTIAHISKVPIIHYNRNQLQNALPLAHKEFNKAIARRLADRLNPSPIWKWARANSY